MQQKLQKNQSKINGNHFLKEKLFTHAHMIYILHMINIIRHLDYGFQDMMRFVFYFFYYSHIYYSQLNYLFKLF